MTHRTFTVSVAGVIVNSDGRVLLLNHVLRPRSGWGLPGGYVDHGEQPEAAFRREIFEETGVELTAVKYYHIRSIKSHIEILYTARTDAEPRVSSWEIYELGWFDVEGLPPELSEQQQDVIHKVLRAEV